VLWYNIHPSKALQCTRAVQLVFKICHRTLQSGHMSPQGVYANDLFFKCVKMTSKMPKELPFLLQQGTTWPPK